MLLISHRGLSATYPENTLRAFQASYDAGMTWIEYDVSLSKDFFPICLHDETLERTSNGSGPASHKTLQELKNLDFGGWKKDAFKGEVIPTLNEILHQFSGKLKMNIEIKGHCHDAKNSQNSIEAQVYKAVKEKNMFEECIVSSFKHSSLERLAGFDKRIRLGCLVRYEPIDKIEKILSTIKYYSLHVGIDNVNDAHVALARKHNLRIIAYVVNTHENYRKATNLELDGIFTDQQPDYFP